MLKIYMQQMIFSCLVDMNVFGISELKIMMEIVELEIRRERLERLESEEKERQERLEREERGRKEKLEREEKEQQERLERDEKQQQEQLEKERLSFRLSLSLY